MVKGEGGGQRAEGRISRRQGRAEGVIREP